MTKSELITALHERNYLGQREVELAVNTLLDHMSKSLAQGERIEIRGFGSFSLSYRSSRTGRNPATGDSVVVQARCVSHYRPGKELRERVMTTWANSQDDPAVLVLRTVLTPQIA